MSAYILAIDQGTGGTKSVLFDERGGIRAKGFAGLASSYPRPGFVEQDPGDIYANVIASVRDCLEKAPDAAGRIAAAGISNQRETFLLFGRDGAPLTRAIVWQCKRSTGVCARLKEAGLEAEVRARTGLLIDPYFSGTKLAWLMENDPAVRDAVRSGQALFGTVDTWLLYRLTRGASFLTDHANASRTLFFNIHSLDWDETLLEALGAKGLVLPRPCPSSFDFGTSDFEGLLPRPIPISGMIGDSHAAAFGEGCFAPGQAKATLGTGSSILCNIGGAPKASDRGMVTTICFSLPGRVDYAFEGVIVTCGATIKWLRDQLGLIASSAETEAMAKAVPDNGGVYLIPAFSGLGAPHWKMDATASIVGLTLGSTKNHVVRAALESVAFQIKDVVAAMELDGGAGLTELKLDGGMTANRFLMRRIADLLGVRTATIGLEEASALGAAYMAGLNAGVFDSVEALSRLHGAEDIYEPRENPEILRDYETWGRMIAKHA